MPAHNPIEQQAVALTKDSRYVVTVLRDVRIPTEVPDVTLSGDLFLPANAGPVPVLITVEPYRRDARGGLSWWEWHHWFASRGYACLLVEFRGSGSSDGELRPPFDPNEADDGVAAIAWAASQPWCDGNVGMWGQSYGAITSMRTASRRPPHLKAILPVMGMTDPERDFVHPHGLRGCMSSFGWWGLTTLMDYLLPPLDGEHMADQQRRWRSRLTDAEPFLLDLIRREPGDAVWRSRTVDASAILVPSLCVGGWRDLFCEGQIRAFEQIKGPKELIVGPWMHSMPHESPFGSIDFLNIALAWWDRWLRDGNDQARGVPVTLFVQGNNSRWVQFTTWPPNDETVEMSLSFTGQSGALTDSSPSLVDPTVGSLSGLTGTPMSKFGLPLDQHDDDMRGIALTGQALEGPLLIVGRPIIEVSGDAPSIPHNLIVKLTDVDPDGRSVMITSGVRGRAPVNSQTVSVGPSASKSAATCIAELTPTCYEVPAGHRLRVVLAGADFPTLWPALEQSDGQINPNQVRVLVRLPIARSLPTECPLHVPSQVDASLSLRLREELKWEISRDLTADGIQVTIGREAESYLPGRQHLYEIKYEVSAEVRRSSANDARVRGKSSARIRMSSGQRVVVEAETYITESAAIASGKVTVDNTEVFTGQWTA